MEKTVSVSKKSKSFISFLFLMFVGIFTMFTFSACKLTNSGGSGGNATFDSSGNLKLVTPFVEFNKYSTTSDGTEVVDENSGSFSWTLQYYYSGDNESYLKNIDFDQDYLFANFFTDTNFDTVQKATTEIAPLPSNDTYTEDGNDKYFKNNNTKYYSPALYVETKDISYPSFEVVVDGNYFTFKVVVNKDYLEKISNDEIAATVGDRETQLKNIFIDTSYNYETKTWKDDAEYGSLFKFYYRTGKTSDGTFEECPKGLMSYYINNKGEFCIRFNPQLEAGSVNRYLKVKSLAIGDTDKFTASSVRGNSNFSTTCAFEAYALSFEAYSPNSATLDYGGLEYDKDQYYFAYQKTYYNSVDGTNPIKSLTGYFPEGRQVVVSRTMPAESSTYDYSLQNWTMNIKAENSYAYEMKLPGYLSLSEDNFISATNNVVSSSSLALSDAFQIVDFSNAFKTTEYKKKTDTNVTTSTIQENDLVFCYSPTGTDKYFKIQTGKTKSGEPIYQTYKSIGDNTSDKYQGDEIVVTSHNVLNGYKFYANYAKVRNFMMSGTLFAGDNFFSDSSQYLDDVSLTLFFKNRNGEFVLISLDLKEGETTGTFTHEQILSITDLDTNPNSHPNGMTVTIDGSYFKVTGLEIDDFIVFQKEGQSGNRNLAYSFHSPLMTDHDALGATFRALDLVESETKKADRQDVGIIGTQYAESSNLEINLYRVTDTKNNSTESVPLKYLDLLKDSDVSYEVIKSVSSHEDDKGYVTTNIILSLILPSNATLTGYNVETIDIKSSRFFTTTAPSDENEKRSADYVLFTKYDSNTMAEKLVDIEGNPLDDDVNNGTTMTSVTKKVYQITKTIINETNSVTKYSDQYVYYGERLYALDHEEVGGYLSSNGTETIGIYKTAHEEKDGNDYFYLIKEGSSWYTLKYTAVNLNGEVDEDGNETYKVGDIQIYELAVSGEAYRVSTIANGYQTSMKFTNPNNASEEQEVYVYYDVEKVGDKYYYVAPIGKRTTITSVNDSGSEVAKIEDVLYFDQISNFSSLLIDGGIKLGSEILSSAGDCEKAFSSAIGSKLITNCYYYYLSLSEPTELTFSQYLDDGKDSEETITVVSYYTINGTQYTGQVTKDSPSVLITTPVAKDSSGAVIDVNKDLTSNRSGSIVYYSATNKEFASTSNIKAKSTHEGISGVSSFKLDDGTEFTKNGDVFITSSAVYISTYGLVVDATNDLTDGSGSTDKKYSRTITMWEYDSSVGGFKSCELYYDGSDYYYKIIGTTTVKTIVDTVVKYQECKVYDKKGMKLTFKGSSTYLDSITVTNVDNVSTLKSDNTLRVWTGSTYKNEGYEAYTRFVTDYITEYNSDNKVVGWYYPAVKDGSKIRAVSSISIASSNKYNYKYTTESGADVQLYTQEVSENINTYESALHREAHILDSNVNVTVLGKYTTTNDPSNPKIYPSFSSFLTFSKDEAYILDRNSDGQINYYSMDYTTKKNVIEGFPGVTLLAGIPYPNPVLSFTVKHKAWDTPVVNIALDINNGYYVEVMGTKIATEETNLIRDFTTYSFKDTIENLLQNDYIDNAYWVLDQKNFNTIYALVSATEDEHDVEYEVDGVKSYYNYYSYTTTVDEDGNIIKHPTPLSIQNLGMNENDSQIYASGYVGVNENYYFKLYFETTDKNGNLYAKELTTDDVILWSSSASVLTSVPTFDIHTYVQGTDGMIYFTSGTFNNDNIICNGLSGITAGSTQSSDGYYDYSEVMISGVTYAYRTLKSQLDTVSLVGYQFDKMINILNAFDSTDPYFLTGKESAVLVASPIVKINDSAENSYVYRFKEWRVFSRYNSEVLYYNRGVTEGLTDRTNAILRFSSNDAGYFVVFPVYERVFEINTGTAVVDGALNKGGSVNIYYENGDESDVENAYDDELYFVNYEKTTYSGKEGYYYGNLTGYPFLYFTGELYDEKPVYKLLENVYVIDTSTSLTIGSVNTKNESVPLFFSVDDDNVTFFKVIQSFTDGPGIILLENTNGQYYFSGFSGELNEFENDDGFKLSVGGEIQEKKFYEIINTSFTADFFYDDITDASIKTSLPLTYDVEKQTFNVLNIEGNELVSALILFNLNENRFLFETISLDVLLTMIKGLCEGEGVNNSLISKFIESYYNYTKNGNKYTIGDKKWYSNTDKNGGKLTFCSGGLSVTTGDKIATYSINKFTVIKRIDNPYVNGMYLSRLGSLTSGELATDEDGKLYSTQQFKTAYFDRDSHIILQAVAPSGYRFEGWYACEYDEELGCWFTTDEKVQNSENIYSDEIIQAYFNPINKEYYYVTAFYDVETYTDSTDPENPFKYEVFFYYLDSDKTELAVVPDRMLDKVRGYFVNHGSEKNPNYIQVFKRAGGIADESYYYDSTFINAVDTTIYEVEERTFIESIRVLDYGEDGVFYYLSGVGIYQKKEEDDTVRYYRTMTTGNIVVDGDKIEINDFHSNLRFVAKFIETYNEYIFAEDEEASGITIQEVYYSNVSPKQDANEDYIIRTDVDGNNKTYSAKNPSTSDYTVNAIDGTLFALKDENNNTKAVGATDTLLTSCIWDMMKEVVGNDEPYVGLENLKSLVKTGFGATTQTYKVNKLDESLGGIGNQEGKLNLQSMFFDVGTTVHIVVRVEAKMNLSIHSLGMNSKYVLEPICGPTDEYVSANQKLSTNDENRVDYYYYIFKVTYDRDPDNEYVNYLVHPDRGDSIAYDVLSGNNITFYTNSSANEYFEHYDNDNNKILFEETDGKIKLTEYYVNSKISGLDSDVQNEIRDYFNNTEFENLEKALREFSRKLRNPDRLKVAYVMYYCYFDSDETQIEYTIVDGKIKLSSSYVDAKIRAKGISNNTFKKEILEHFENTTFSSFEELGNDGFFKTTLKLTLSQKEWSQTIGEETIVKLEKTEDIYNILKTFFQHKGKSNPYLLRAGQRNFINLSTTEVYNYTIQAIVIDSEGDELTIDKDGKIILPSSNYYETDDEGNNITYPTLSNTIYTAGGINEKSYIGPYTEINGTNVTYTNYDGTSSTTQLKMEYKFEGIEYAGTGTDKDESKLEDLPFMQNTIVLFEGIKNAPTKNDTEYVFVGWYEQKYDNDTLEWSDPVFMSSSDKQPYLSLATADTVVVAVYKRVVEVSFTFNEKEMEVELDNGLIDSTGTIMETLVNEDGIVTLTGKFFFDAKIGAILSPAGGYRFEGINAYNQDNTKVKEDLNNEDFLKYYNYEYGKKVDESYGYMFKECKYDDVILNSILKVEFNLNELLRDYGEEKKAYGGDSATLEFTTQRLTLVYVRVDNFNSVTGHGYNFALKSLDKTKTYYSTTQITGLSKDSTHSSIKRDSIGYGSLAFYGYFDKSLSGDLLLVTSGVDSDVATIRKWYINRDSEDEDKDTAYDKNYSTDKLLGGDGNLTIVFEYPEEKKEYNSDSYYSLNMDNDIYYVKAIIEPNGDFELNVNHYLYKSIQDLIDHNEAEYNSFTDTTFNTYLTSAFNGQRTQPSASTEEDNARKWSISSYGSFEFPKNSTISLTTSTDHVIVYGKLYVFVGWFVMDDSSSTFISSNTSIGSKTAIGNYVACYVRADGVVTNFTDAGFDIETEEDFLVQTEYGKQTKTFQTVYTNISGLKLNDDYNFNYSEGSNIYYVALVGSVLKFEITPNGGKSIVSCSVYAGSNSQINQIAIEKKESIVKSNLSTTKYTTVKIPSVNDESYNQLTIEASIEKGYTVRLTQTLYESFKMEGSGTALTGENFITFYIDTVSDGTTTRRNVTGSELFAEQNVNATSKITLSNNQSNTYYFIGFFINGSIVSRDQNGNYDTKYEQDGFQKSIVIEARYTKYVYVGIQSLVEGTKQMVGLTTGSPFTISYTDPRNSTRTISLVTNENKKELLKAPSGIVATVSVSFSSNAYTFIGFKNSDQYGNTIGEILSTKTVMQYALDSKNQNALTPANTYSYGSNMLVNDIPFINIACVFQKTTYLTVTKNITTSSENQKYFTDETDKNIIDEQFQIMFNVSVTYTDTSGEERTVSMSNTAELKNLGIKKGTKISITPSISSAISYRYSIFDFDFKINAKSNKSFVARTNNTFLIDTSELADSETSLAFMVYFKPSKSLTISKEIIGESTPNEGIVVNYSYKNAQNDDSSGTLTNTNETDIYVSESVDSLTLSVDYPDGENYHFVGWFADGILLSEDDEINQDKENDNVSVKTANSITAKFIKIVELTVERKIYSNGNETSDDELQNLEFSITASFVEIECGKLVYSVQTKNFDELNNSTIRIVAGSKLFIFAEQHPNFQLSFTISGDGSAQTYTTGTNIIDHEGLQSNSTISLKFEEKTKPITYFISTTNTTSTKDDGDALTLSDVTTCLTPTSGISFTGTLKEGYEIESIKVAGKPVNFEHESGTTSFNIKAENVDFKNIVDGNVLVQIYVKKKVNITVYLSFDGFSVSSAVGSSNPVNIKIGEITYSVLPGQKATNENEVIFAQNLTCIAIEGTSYVDGSKTYSFDGFYLYDGKSTATSSSPITFQNSFQVAPFDDFAVVAKFESSKKPSTISTDIIDDNGEDNFAGWFARVNSTTSESGYEDILVSKSYNDKTYLKGMFDRIVASYFDVESYSKKTINISGTDGNEIYKSGHAIVYVSTASLSEKVEFLGDSSSFNLNKLTNETAWHVQFVADGGFAINSSSETNCNIEKLFYMNTISARNNKITNVDTNENATKNSITINGLNDTFKLYVILENSKSSANLNILKSGTTDFESTTLSLSNKQYSNGGIAIGSSIFISIDLIVFEKMVGFDVSINDGDAQRFSKATLRYVTDSLSDGDEVTIKVLCRETSISTIIENNNSNGSASITEDEDGNHTVEIKAFEGYMISKIEFVTINKNGFISENSTTLLGSTGFDESMSGSISNITETKTDADSFGDMLLTGVSFTYEGNNNLGFNVTYERYAKVNFKVVNSDEETVQTITKYVLEENFPLTLETIEGFKLTEKLEDKYKSLGLNHYSYKGQYIDSVTEIQYEDRILEINLCLNKSYEVIFSIQTIEDYNSSRDGLQIVIGEKTIATNGSTYTLYYSAAEISISGLSDKFNPTEPILASDKNNNYVFKGFYAKYVILKDENDNIIGEDYTNLISSSAEYVFRTFDIEDCDKVDDTDQYILYAVFEEVTETFVIDRDFPTELIEKENAGLTFKFNGESVTVDGEKTVVLNGQMMKISKEGSKYSIEVPHAFNNNNLTVTLDNGWIKNTDSLHDSEFYDYEDYRFDNFFEQSGRKIGTDYSNTVDIELSSNLNNTTITAKVIKLHTIEFSSSNMASGMDIELYVKKISFDSFILVDFKYYDSNYTNNIKSGIISYKIEEGMQARVKVLFNSVYDTSLPAKFISIVVSSQTLLTTPDSTYNKFASLVNGETIGLEEAFTQKKYYSLLLDADDVIKYENLLKAYDDDVVDDFDIYNVALNGSVKTYEYYLDFYNNVEKVGYDDYKEILGQEAADEYKNLLDKTEKSEDDYEKIACYQNSIKDGIKNINLFSNALETIKTYVANEIKVYQFGEDGNSGMKAKWYDSWEKFYSDYGFIAVSKADNPDNQFNSLVNNNTSSYEFTVSENLAFVADFSGNSDMFKLLKKTYITSSLWTTINNKETKTLSSLKKGSIYANSYSGNGFTFSLSSTSKGTYTATTNSSYLKNDFYNLKTSFKNQPDEDGLFSLTEGNQSENKGSNDYHQLNFNLVLTKKATYDFSASKIIKSSTEVAITKLEENNVKLEFTDDDAIGGSEERKTDGTFEDATISAFEVSGYYFKGFALVSTNYDSTFELSKINGDKENETIQQYNFLNHTVSYDDEGKIVFKATFKYSGDVNVVAVYEPTVYIITLNTYKFFEENTVNKLNKENEEDTGVVEKDREIVEANKIKGSLLALHGTSIKITSINFQYTQFVGFTGTSETNQDIEFGYDFGEGLSSNSDEINKYFYDKDIDGNTQHVDTSESMEIYVNGVDKEPETLTGINLYRYCLSELQDGNEVKYRDKDSKVQTLTTADLETKFYRFKGILNGDTIAKLYPGQNSDETFVSTASRNNIYALNVQQNFTLNLYFTNLFYKLIIDLAETESTIQYSNSTGGNDNAITKENSNVYLAYSDEYTALQKYYADKIKAEKEGKEFTKDYVNDYLNNSEYKFTNPSAGTYYYKKNYGTTDANDTPNKYSITIDPDDPYVYVMNDSDGNFIGYPTKIAVGLVAFQDSTDESVTVKDMFYSNTNNKVQIAIANIEFAKYDSTYEDNKKNYEENKDSIISYLQAYANPRLGADGGTLIKYGFDYNVSDIVDVSETGKSDLRPTLRNILNYADSNEGFQKLVSGLFTITISGVDGIKVVSSDGKTNGSIDKNMSFEIDISKGTARVIYKVVASDAGFPSVKVQMFDKKSNSKLDLPESVLSVHIENDTKTENKQSKAETTAGKEISGFNMELFSDDSSFTDLAFSLGNIDVNLTMTWQTSAKPVEAVVTLSDSKTSEEFILTGLKTAQNKDVSYGDGHKDCIDAQPNGVNKHEDEEIRAYFIIIIKNGYALIEMIQKFVEEGNLDETVAGMLMYYLLTAPFGVTDGFGSLYSSEDAQIGNGATGSLFEGSSDRAYYFKMLKEVAEIVYGTDISNSFTYRVIDVYELYKNNINGNFFNNAVNTSDLVVTQCVLQEHQESQVNHTGGWLGWLWSAEKGYAYYRSATGYVDASKNNGSYSSTYANAIDETASTSTSTGKTKGVWKTIVGFFDSGAGFSGTYNRFITVGFAASDKDLMENTSIIARTVIDKSKNKVVSREYDYNPIPITNAVVSVVSTLAPLALGFIPGVGPFLFATWYVYVLGDCIWKICDTDHRSVADFFANMW